jgi:hypothetical protein
VRHHPVLIGESSSLRSYPGDAIWPCIASRSPYGIGDAGAEAWSLGACVVDVTTIDPRTFHAWLRYRALRKYENTGEEPLQEHALEWQSNLLCLMSNVSSAIGFRLVHLPERAASCPRLVGSEVAEVEIILCRYASLNGEPISMNFAVVYETNCHLT